MIKDVPHVRQKPDFCGEACVASWLKKIGVRADQDDVFNISGLDPALGRGCFTRELSAAIQRIGFQSGVVWHTVPVARKDQAIQALFSELMEDLSNDIPSIICMRTSDGPQATEHFRLVLGYDRDRDEIIYHEPADDNGAYHRMARSKLFQLWPLKYKPNEWTVIRFALRSQRQPHFPRTDTFTDADFAQHIMKLKRRLPNRDFRILVEYPFVVVSDESPERMKRRAEGVVRWSTSKLKESYFPKDPNQILDIWLFKDKESYDTNNVRLFGKQPSTPYGYYSPSDGALVMNIATGGGTLVHEIVHPFMEANFPNCPSWLNEGLGSLYEQSSTRRGKIIGLTNWRLAGLQRAIEQDAVPPFGELCSTTTNQFYHSDPGTNYAQARYLCYYLQERELLRTYYHDFVKNQKQDPTGFQTLKKTLGVDDMAAFKKEWETFVMKLRFN